MVKMMIISGIIDDNQTNTTTISTIPATTSFSFTTLTSERTVTEISTEPIIISYVTGILVVVVLLVGSLAILMLVAFVYKNRKEKKQRYRELIILMVVKLMVNNIIIVSLTCMSIIFNHKYSISNNNKFSRP